MANEQSFLSEEVGYQQAPPPYDLNKISAEGDDVVCCTQQNQRDSYEPSPDLLFQQLHPHLDPCPHQPPPTPGVIQNIPETSDDLDHTLPPPIITTQQPTPPLADECRHLADPPADLNETLLKINETLLKMKSTDDIKAAVTKSLVDLNETLLKMNSTMQNLGTMISMMIKTDRAAAARADIFGKASIIADEHIERLKQQQMQKTNTPNSSGPPIFIDIDASHAALPQSAGSIISKKRKHRNYNNTHGGMVSLSALGANDSALSIQALLTARKKDLQRDWVKLLAGTNVHISGSVLKPFAEGAVDMDWPTGCALARMLQLKELRKKTSCPRNELKHFFTADGQKLNNIGDSIYEMSSFIQAPTEYNPADCYIFVAFLIINLQWVSYVFDIHNNVICILDPMAGKEREDSILETHRSNSNIILQAILNYIRKSLRGCNIGKNEWQTKPFTTPNLQPVRNNTGVYAFMCGQLIDPQKGIIAKTNGDVEMNRHMLVDDLLNMPCNMAVKRSTARP